MLRLKDDLRTGAEGDARVIEWHMRGQRRGASRSAQGRERAENNATVWKI